MEMKKEDLARINELAWGVILNGLAKEKERILKKDKKWGLESKTKLKSLIEGLRQFEDPNNSILHFIKFAEYSLPRSHLDKTLIELLNAVKELREDESDPELLKKKLHYLLGYINWSIETFLNVLNSDEKNVKENLRTILMTEGAIIDYEEGIEEKVKELIEWKNRSLKNGR